MRVQSIYRIVKSRVGPRSIYKISTIEEILDDGIIIEGSLFKGTMLKKVLSNVKRVFPFSITPGTELEKMVETTEDFVKKYYLDVIGNLYLTKAKAELKNRLKLKFNLTQS